MLSGIRVRPREARNLQNIATRSALTCLRFLSLCPLDIAYRAYHRQLEVVLLMSTDFGGGRVLKRRGSGSVVTRA